MKKIFLTTSVMLIFCLFFACKKRPSTANSCRTCTTCVTDVLEVDTIGSGNGWGFLHTNNYAAQDTFYGKNNSAGYSQVVRTINGYYGGKGLSIKFNLDSLMPNNLPTQVSFTHARLIGNTITDSTLINLQLPGTPLFITTTDSIPYYVGLYGYTAVVYSNISSLISYPNITQGVMADSVVITNTTAFNKCIIGANLFESELRNICFKN